MIKAFSGQLIDLLKQAEKVSVSLPDDHEGTIYSDAPPVDCHESTVAAVYSVADDEEEPGRNIEGKVYFLEMEIALEIMEQYEATCRRRLSRAMTPVERFKAVRYYAEHDAYIDERDLWPELE